MGNTEMDINHPSGPPPGTAPAAAVAPETVIELRGLSKVYDGVQAVERLDLDIPAGRILGLVGPNGAGKTTTMRCMAGIIPPTAGSVRIAGFDLATDALRAKARLAFVPDTPHLFDYLSVEEHLRFAARLYQVPDVERRSAELLEEFELADKRRNLPPSLSRGMKQKVAICLGFLHSPRAIILDEPLTGLDPLGIRRMKNSILRRAREDQAAVIISSHQLELVEEICDEVLIINKGKHVISGTLSSIRDRLGAGSEELSLEAMFFRLTVQQPDAQERAPT
jgi:ABC-2 type transport system ATP-binding protein